MNKERYPNQKNERTSQKALSIIINKKSNKRRAGNAGKMNLRKWLLFIFTENGGT
jgi:hypothetical protein